MSKIQKISLFLFVVMLGFMVYAEANKPKKINWFKSYSKDDKIPYGTFVLYDLMKESFGADFKETAIPPYVQLTSMETSGTYFFINDYIYFDDAELNEMLYWVEKGNSLFVSSNYFAPNLTDTLQIALKTDFLLNKLTDQGLIELSNTAFKTPKPYHIDLNLDVLYFNKLDTLNTTILGFSQVYNDTLSISKPNANFVRISHGNGTLFLHTQPEVFTNYFLLKEDNVSYVQNLLSYVNDGKPLLWDNYYRSGKTVNVSPFYIIHNNKHLKWGYYLLMATALIFVFFEGKRKQRSIPVITPVINRSFEYTQTIAGMYFDKKENHEIAIKQIAFFLEYIRTRLRIPTEKINQHFFETLSGISQLPVQDVRALFQNMDTIQNKANVSDTELKKLYTDINDFKSHIDGN